MAVVILGGVTAAGKSDLALELAQEYGAAIVSADAMTVFRGMSIGTAKPNQAVLDRLPHACVDVVDPDEDFSVADFVETFQEVASTSTNVLVVGGTPFYLSALVRPLADMPASDPEVRAQLEAIEDPHARLMSIDPESAARLHPNDTMRVVRALEVHAISGHTMTELHSRGGRIEPVDATVVWMDRANLEERIESRLQQMVHAGYVGEVESLLTAGWSVDLKPLRSFSYRHIVDHVGGEIDEAEAIRRTARDTRRFARKQRTWARGMGWQAVGQEKARLAASAAFSGE